VVDHMSRLWVQFLAPHTQTYPPRHGGVIVVPATWLAKQEDPLSLDVQGQPWQNSTILSL
jgi:hypothetical protein